MPADVLPQIPPPPDASDVSDWVQAPEELRARAFVGTGREACGFTVRVEGVQYVSRRCVRQVVVVAPALESRREPEALRQLAAALVAAAAEVEALR